MNQDSRGAFNPFDPTGAFQQARDAGMGAWSEMMIELVNTDAYAEATGAMLDTWLTTSGPFQKVMEESMARACDGLNLPSRDSITRLAERLTNIEMRLDDMEARLDADLRPGKSSEKSKAAREERK